MRHPVDTSTITNPTTQIYVHYVDSNFSIVQVNNLEKFPFVQYFIEKFDNSFYTAVLVFNKMVKNEIINLPLERKHL
jgi:hypothetical protein